MKIQILSIACITAAVALLAACTTGFRNSGACEQLMRSKLADTSPDTLTVDHRGAAIRGSRVVIEGSIEHVTTASESAATAASAASSAQAAAAADAASATRASGGGGASVMSPASEISADASDAAAASAASEVKPGAAKSAKPKTVTTAAAAECTFHGSELDVFRWLAPARLATPVDEAASATAG